MTDIKAKKEEKSPSQTNSKSDSKTTPDVKEGLFSELLMPRGLGKIDENTGLKPSLLKSDAAIGTGLMDIPEAAEGKVGKEHGVCRVTEGLRTQVPLETSCREEEERPWSGLRPEVLQEPPQTCVCSVPFILKRWDFSENANISVFLNPPAKSFSTCVK